MKPSSGVVLIIIFFYLSLMLSVTLYANATTFLGEKFVESNTGYAQISWKKMGSKEFELQRSLRMDFSDVKSVYRGSDSSVFISGLKDDVYYFRVRGLEKEGLPISPWSDVKVITVKHHPLSTAIGLFGLGMVSFLAILLVIFYGHKKHRQEFGSL